MILDCSVFDRQYISGSPKNRTIFDWSYTNGLANPYKDLPSRNRNPCAPTKREPYLSMVSIGDSVHRVYKSRPLLQINVIRSSKCSSLSFYSDKKGSSLALLSVGVNNYIIQPKERLGSSWLVCISLSILNWIKRTGHKT